MLLPMSEENVALVRAYLDDPSAGEPGKRRVIPQTGAVSPQGVRVPIRTMPLTCCPTCGLTVYSAAGHSTRDECPQCASELPPFASSVRRSMRRRYLPALNGFLRRTGRSQRAWLLRKP